MKIDLNIVAAALREESTIPAHILKRLLEKLKGEVDEPKASTGPKAKQQHCIIVSDKSNLPLLDLAGNATERGKQVEAILKDTVGWVLTIPEGEPPTNALAAIRAAADSHNNGKRSRRSPATSIGEVCERVGSKHWKDLVSGKKLATVRTKLPVTVILAANRL